MAEVSNRIIKNVNSTYLNESGKNNKDAILFLHGSGPGASAWSNWQYIMPEFGEKFYCLAPDLVGFGKSHHPEDPPKGMRNWMRLWMDQLISLLDELNLEKVHIVGNSMGGAIALQLLMDFPDRFNRVVLMGPAGAPTKITPELDRTWGYYDDPSPELMANMISWFSYDQSIIGDQLKDISKMRHKATLDTNIRRSFEAMFPAPRQQHLDELVIPDGSLRGMDHPILIIHGQEDLLVNVETSYYLIKHLPNVQMHIFSHCSHWTQIEYKESFHYLLKGFFEENY
ncbi:MAG: 2-hydroxy-6-oxo-6-phenylhexa-2,4-dienoate hydrolase [Ignavibacteriae bacterium]|nr:2-hydroxy-6-oxo-6-phenylhexa-2,4-dienoate hydrolase [Ignavibacteriota bacterium]|tara:strand:- start:59 stop:910 length:852 start_codon:yes stop_codon:yes gene_type:complete